MTASRQRRPLRQLRAIALGLLAAGAAASPATAETLDCAFKKGVVQTWTGRGFKPKPAAGLSFTIEAIDREKQTARLTTSKGSGTLRVVNALDASHFLEVITEGFLTVTTVYGSAGSPGPRAAVHARHIGLLGQPLVAHYTGSCTVKP